MGTATLPPGGMLHYLLMPQRLLIYIVLCLCVCLCVFIYSYGIKKSKSALHKSLNLSRLDLRLGLDK